MKFKEYTAIELGTMIKERKVTVKEVVDEHLKEIKRVDKEINAFITIDEESIYKRVEEVQKLIDNGQLDSPIAGIPIGIKDNICTKGIRTTCGSKILKDFVPTYSATVIERLEDAGAIIIGKTNMDEFAMGSTTETSAYGITYNPRNMECVPGGSSGGSCASVAASECVLALGTDTGGSIRQPAAHCGVVGIKPTYGTVSRYGLIAYASSLDQVGPIGKNVTDCVNLLDVIASYDIKDSTSIKRENYNFSSWLVKDVKGMKVAIPHNFVTDKLDDEVKEVILKIADLLKEQGAIVEYIDLKLLEYVIPTYYTIASAEASSNLAR